MPKSTLQLSRRGLLGGAGALATAHLLSACQTAATQSPRAYPALQALIDRYVSEGKLSGAMIAMKKDRDPVRYLSAGRIALGADAPVSDPDLLYRIYSMTKPITGIAAMQLIERGRLALDQPIADFIPEFRQMRVLDARDEPRPMRRKIRFWCAIC